MTNKEVWEPMFNFVGMMGDLERTGLRHGATLEEVNDFTQDCHDFDFESQEDLDNAWIKFDGLV